jgi:hypothetical protein
VPVAVAGCSLSYNFFSSDLNDTHEHLGHMYESMELGDFDTVFWRRHSEVAGIDKMDSAYISAESHRGFQRGQGTLNIVNGKWAAPASVSLFELVEWSKWS